MLGADFCMAAAPGGLVSRAQAFARFVEGNSCKQPPKPPTQPAATSPQPQAHRQLQHGSPSAVLEHAQAAQGAVLPAAPSPGAAQGGVVIKVEAALTFAQQSPASSAPADAALQRKQKPRKGQAPGRRKDLVRRAVPTLVQAAAARQQQMPADLGMGDAAADDQRQRTVMPGVTVPAMPAVQVEAGRGRKRPAAAAAAGGGGGSSAGTGGVVAVQAGSPVPGREGKRRAKALQPSVQLEGVAGAVKRSPPGPASGAGAVAVDLDVTAALAELGGKHSSAVQPAVAAAVGAEAAAAEAASHHQEGFSLGGQPANMSCSEAPAAGGKATGLGVSLHTEPTLLLQEVLHDQLPNLPPQQQQQGETQQAPTDERQQQQQPAQAAHQVAGNAPGVSAACARLPTSLMPKRRKATSLTRAAQPQAPPQAQAQGQGQMPAGAPAQVQGQTQAQGWQEQPAQAQPNGQGHPDAQSAAPAAAPTAPAPATGPQRKRVVWDEHCNLVFLDGVMRYYHGIGPWVKIRHAHPELPGDNRTLQDRFEVIRKAAARQFHGSRDNSYTPQVRTKAIEVCIQLGFLNRDKLFPSTAGGAAHQPTGAPAAAAPAMAAATPAAAATAAAVAGPGAMPGVGAVSGSVAESFAEPPTSPAVSPDGPSHTHAQVQ